MAIGTYSPRAPPPDASLDDIARYIRDEFVFLARALAEDDVLELRERNAEPDKQRVGMIVYADGTNWNPGSGEGLYVYKSGGWTFIV